MRVVDGVEVKVWAPRARFPLQKEPAFVWTDFPWESGVAMWGENDGLVSDYALQIVHPAPVRVPHNNRLAAAEDAAYDAAYIVMGAANGQDTGLPSQSWEKGASHAGSWKFLPVWGRDWSKPLGLYIYASSYADAEAGAGQLESTLDCQCFEFNVTVRRQPDRSLASGALGGTTAVPNVRTECSVAVAVGESSDRVFYRVRFLANGDYQIEKTDPGGTTFNVLQSFPRRGALNFAIQTVAAGPSDLPLHVEFRLLAGRMRVTVGDNGDPVYFDEFRQTGAGAPLYKLSLARVEFTRCMGVNVFGGPVWWREVSTYTSPEQQIGFASASDATLSTVYAQSEPATWAAAFTGANSLTGPTIEYSVEVNGPSDGTFKGTAYSKLCRPIRAFNLQWPGVRVFSPAAPVTPRPEVSIVQHTFNPDELSIGSVATQWYNATHAVNLPTGEFGHWGPWSLQRGQVAQEVWHGRNTPTFPTLLFPELVFTGYGHRKGEVEALGGGEFAFKMTGCDRRCQLMSPRWNLPWMDGWNVYYAMAYLAELGGVAIDDLVFAALVPADPFTDLGDGHGNPAYFLPTGAAGSVLTRHSGAPLWRVMLKISNAIGYLLFFNVAGALYFDKFVLPTGVKRTFFESDAHAAVGGGSGLEGAWNCHLAKDMDQVRSDAIVVGLNAFAPQWDPVVYKYSDAGVVDDPLAFNHLGYPNPSVWVDTQFGLASYADTAAQAMIRFLRYPGLDVVWSTWAQPDIFPLDVVSLDSVRMGTTGIRLMVVNVRHKSDKGAPETLIGARFVPDV